MEMDLDENLNEVPPVGDSGSEAEKSKAKNSASGSLDEDNKLEDDKPCKTLEDSVQPASEGGGACSSQVGSKVTETDAVPEEVKEAPDTGNGCLPVSPIRSPVIDGRSVSGVKRARITVDEHQPSVRFVYNSLTRASRQKLEELLRQWSEWHDKHVSSSSDPSDEGLESGEKTFFPALHVGLENSSAVSFWMDNQTRNDTSKDFIPLDGNSVPLYDRGYALGLTSADGSSKADGGLEIVDAASRCFNCGSYSHSLRDCPRPRDNMAVNNARKQLKSRRNQNSASRNPTRYYQNSPAGKYDGLRPGALDDVTRQLLGLGELDPPPWLNRMREIGYPPGYLDVDDEDEPSGITIYTDRDISEQEDGEIMEVEASKSKRKMTVKFPGINAPIPENADERLWAAGAGRSSSDVPNISRSWPQHRSNYSTDYGTRGYHREQRWSGDFRGEQRLSGDFRGEQRFLGDIRGEQRFSGDFRGEQRLSEDFRGEQRLSGDFRGEQRLSGDFRVEQRLSGDFRDDAPPGDPGYGSLMHTFQPRYGGGHDSLPRSPSMARSFSERGRRSPLHDEESPKPVSFHSLHYSTSERFLSPLDRDLGGRFGSSTPESLYDRDRDRTYRTHSDDRHYRSWR